MRRFIPLVFFIFPCLAPAQNGKLSLGISGGPAYVDFAPVRGFDHHFSKAKFNCTAGLEGDYRFSDKNGLGFGLNFFTINYKLEYAWIFQQPGDPQIPRTTTVNSSWLEIPLSWNFYTPYKNVEARGSLGVFYAAQLNAGEQTEFEDNSVRPSAYQYNAEYGMRWAVDFGFHFQNAFSLRAGFGGHLFLAPLSEFMTRGLSGEIKIGVSYRFP